MLSEIHLAMREETWAIRESALAIMASERLVTKAVGPRKLPRVQGNVAVLPLHGMISQRASLWQEFFGGTSTESFGAAFQRAIGDPKVGGVIIDVDSPGGTTSGVQELADLIWEGSQRKPVAAIANSDMASAAYWLASQVGAGSKRLVAAPGADVGSIGVFRMHQDVSEALASQGVKMTMLAVPEYKTEANPFEPLTDQARDHHMGQVQAAYEEFVAAVSRGRSVSPGVVRSSFGKGRMFHASQAASMGLVDRVATLGQLAGEMLGGAVQATASEAAMLQDELCHAWETGEVGITVTQYSGHIADRLRVARKALFRP